MPGSRNAGVTPETQAIHTVAAMLGGATGSVDRAAGLLTLLRDPVRRTLLESLSRTPSRAAPALIHATGAGAEDLYHHLRCLTRSGALTRSRHHTYAVDPAALTAVRCYFDALLALSAMNDRASPVELDLDAALEALADPLRRIIFERIVIRPRRVVDLTEGLGVTRPAVSYHVKVLREAAMIEEIGARLTVRAEVLPALRVYFDRLWLEASLGDSWLNRRRIRSDDLGL